MANCATLAAAMRKRLCFAAMLLFAIAAFASQAVEPSRTPYERRGLYHATIRGRFLSHTGESVAGVHVQLNAGGPRALPLVDVETGPDGRFTMLDVNSIYPPYLTWFPPEEWLRGSTAIDGESGGEIDLGEVRLRQDSIVRIAIELVGGTPLKLQGADSSVSLETDGEFPQRVFAEGEGSEFALRQVPFDDGQLKVTLYTEPRTEIFSVPFHVQRGRRDRIIRCRLLRDTAKPMSPYHSEGRMEISESRVLPTPVEREFRATGSIQAPDGSPVAGAFVNVNDIAFGEVMPQWVLTGAQGEYDFRIRSRECPVPVVSYGDTDYWYIYQIQQDGREIPCEDLLRNPREAVMPFSARLTIRVQGVDPSRMSVSWWHDSFGWQRFASIQPWLPTAGLRDERIKVEAEGYLPLTQKLKLPYLGGSEGPPPAPQVDVKATFDGTVRRRLVVRGDGKPLAAATVDLEAIEDLASDRRQFLATYRTKSDGSLELLGGGDRMVEAFVYAEGFEPQRTIWNAGELRVFNLVPRAATLKFPASSAVVVSRVRSAASPQAVRTIGLSGDRPTLARFAAGTYDITCYSGAGKVIGYLRVSAAAGNTTAVDCSVDQRPRLTLRYPVSDWKVFLSESEPRGGATQWAVMILVGNGSGFEDVLATPEHQSASEVTWALSHAGKVHIEAWSGRYALILWREVDLQPKQSLAISLPTGTATLKGSMRSYDGGLAPEDHGFAGPRMQLIADDPSAWSVTEYMPERDAQKDEARHRFTVRGLPAGSYHLYQHLVGTKQIYASEARTVEILRPLDAWGGIPVKLDANHTTQLPDFIEYPLKDLQVRVEDAEGRPVEHATLRIRDRMSDAWRQVQENPRQLEQAAYPIPYPAASRIVAGEATLPRIREGWLELAVEVDAGPVYRFTAPVRAGQELHLVLPVAMEP